MKRIAFFGPVKPSHTGIADYDEALLPLLKQQYEVDVFVENRLRRNGVYPHHDFYRRHSIRPYDLTLYQLGNSTFHEYTYGYMYHYPGATVFHDSCLHHSRAAMWVRRGYYQEYEEEVRLEYSQADQITAALRARKDGGLLLYYFPFVKLILQCSLAAASHNEEISTKLRITETPVLTIPHLELPSLAEPGEDPFPGKIVVASFGLATRSKRISAVMQAIAYLRTYYPNLLYLIAGEIENASKLELEIADHGFEKMVHVTGYIDETEFLRLMTRADIVVNLRYPSAGEMSGTLIRALAAGKPVLISRLSHLMQIPDDAVLRVRPDQETGDVVRHLRRLIEEPGLRAQMGRAARRYIDEHHRPDQALEKYTELIQLALDRKASFRPPPLPLHLREADEILRDYIRRTSLGDSNSALLDWIL
jgi:glycosyltransferase involved in cell wall biosynthesis